MAKNRYSATDYFSSSAATAQVEEELTSAQARIADLETVNQELLSKIEQLAGTTPTAITTARATLPVNAIQRDPEQVRRWFDPEKQASLAKAIQEAGFRGTIWVRQLPSGEYCLIAGERRLRAAIEAGLSEVPVDILDVDENVAFTLSLFENLQREDLNKLEETEGILKLISKRLNQTTEETTSLLYRMKNFHEGKLTNEPDPEFDVVESIFATLGRLSWLSFVTTRLPLLNMPPEILEELRKGTIEYTKAIVISRVKDTKARKKLLKETLSNSLSLSEVKRQAKSLSTVSKTEHSKLQDRFRQVLKIKSRVWEDPERADELEALLQQLSLLLADDSQ